MAMNGSGLGAVASASVQKAQIHESDLTQIRMSILHKRDRLESIESRLRNLGDRAFGPRGEDASVSMGAPVVSGEVANTREALDSMESVINRIMDMCDRIENLV